MNAIQKSVLRAGSSSEKASHQQYEALISEHLSKVRAVREHLNQVVRVRWINKRPGELVLTHNYSGSADCQIVDCDHITVRIQDIASGAYYEEQVDILELTRDAATTRLILIFRRPA